MDFELITGSLFDAVEGRARASGRGRMNHNFHASPQELTHRFLNVLLRNTYIRPHRHLDPPKTETFLVLEGSVAFYQFDDNGHVTGKCRLGPEEEALGIDLKPGVWHTLTALSERAICFEVKPGPWDPLTDKEFAVWAPHEDDPASVEWLQHLLTV